MQGLVADVNPMMYRVFLEEQDSTHVAIRSGEILAWTCQTGRYQPKIESQLGQTTYDSIIGPFPEKIDGHWLIQSNSSPLAIVHHRSELPDMVYSLAKEEALKIQRGMSDRFEVPYILIDLTSRGSRSESEALAKIVFEKELRE